MRPRFLVTAFLFVAVCLPAAPLQRRYEEWLNGPTSYLITKQEREAFVHLSSDAERDTLIERFWAIRNPEPGSGSNEFKDEFFRRVAWANAQYGPKSGTDGWRTDMGRTYILFGKPQQVSSFVHHQDLRPMELWFYQNPGLTELPPFFYVLFYEKDDISGFRVYHPYVDGPDKLVRTSRDKAQAYNYLRQINAELARASLSLIPGEPVDTESFAGSMESAQIVNAIQGYRDMPSYSRLIRQRTLMLESVKSRIRYDVAASSLIAFVAHERGEPWLYWQLEIRDPLQPKAQDGRIRYDIRAQLYSGEKLIFERSDTPQFAAPSETAADLNKRAFVYEDRMPVVPGTYRLVVSARNHAAARDYQAAREFSVEAPGALAISDVLGIARFEPDRRERPFQFGGVKFTPTALPTTQSIRGLRILYQVSLPEPRPADLSVEYIIGNVGSKARRTYEDKLDPKLADAYGSITTSKVLATEELPPGAYQLVVRVKDVATGKLTARSAPFRIADVEEDEIRPIVVSRGNLGTPQWIAGSHYERALAWLSQGRQAEALAALELSRQTAHNAPAEELIRKLRGQGREGDGTPAGRK
ncbi:MAG TPA: GWxTD domain-containing protein [Bryobacteraceae bacterium]|nr:GWxTD domain-containing protein [Bryobacteraceae bacterium]